MRLILLIPFLIFYLNLTAQTNLKGVVYYGHKQSFGMGAPIGNDYNSELIFNSTNSTYTFAKDSLEGEHVREMIPIKNDKGIFMIMKTTTKEGFIYNINRTTNLIKSRDIGYNYVSDTIPKLAWKILNETKKIGNFECTKATCNFRGRNYTAWFSLKIPLPFGPWKLQGLPGLILEAYDTDKEIYFYFKSIEYPSEKELKITIPNPETNRDMERNRPTKERVWIAYDDFKKEMIKRHRIGTKMGRMAAEQNANTQSSVNNNPMRKTYIEVFDEK